MTSQHVLLVAAPRSGAGLLEELFTLDARWTTTALSRPVADEPDADALAGLVTSAFSEAQHTVDWLPRWSMRIAEIARVAPELKFVYVVRDPRYSVSSSAVAWRSGRFVTEPDLAGWWGEKWSFPLVPEWELLVGKPLHQVVATQWLGISAAIREGLALLDPARFTVVTYEQLVADPSGTMAAVCRDLDIDWEAVLPEQLPRSARTITNPDPQRVLPDIEEIAVGLEAAGDARAAFIEWAGARGLTSYAEPLRFDVRPEVGGTTRSSADTPFRSSHTKTFVELLEKSQTSLLLTTYKSGHVIIARAAEGRLDTAITSMTRPMGVAVAGNRLAIGGADSIVTYANHAAMGANLKSQRPYDTVYVPRAIAFTGDVAIHEMDYDAGGQLWFVNTRFSCLCTMDLDNSFTPRWRPTWITALAAEDRCHLNGMVMEDGAPKYVTALARTDTAGGWREHKGTSGVIVDITTDEVIVEGLSMPHSPRLHQGHMWVLESGKGALVRIDRTTGKRTEVARVPGFARGLAFIGRYAVIGLSQVRESVFTGLPVTESAAERNCGAWIVDTEAGTVVGQLKFEGVVQEIFDVKALPGARWPVLTAPGELTASAFSLDAATIANLAATQA